MGDRQILSAATQDIMNLFTNLLILLVRVVIFCG
jgi:hypothetical protein